MPGHEALLVDPPEGFEIAGVGVAQGKIHGSYFNRRVWI